MGVFANCQLYSPCYTLKEKANEQSTVHVVFLIKKFVYKLKPPSLVGLTGIGPGVAMIVDG
jgi:hypothetical protein